MIIPLRETELRVIKRLGARIGPTGCVTAVLVGAGLLAPASSSAITDWTLFCNKTYSHNEVCRLGQPNPSYVYTYEVEGNEYNANNANTCVGAYAYIGGQAMGGSFPCSWGTTTVTAGPFGYDSSNPSNPMVEALNNANGTTHKGGYETY
jgi:hypothetical protein